MAEAGLENTFRGGGTCDDLGGGGKIKWAIWDYGYILKLLCSYVQKNLMQVAQEKLHKYKFNS